jgi:citrate synthase
LKKIDVISRQDPFVKKAKTRIWREVSVDANPYLVDRAECYGYPQLDLLKSGYGPTEMLYLLVTGELPTHEQKSLLDTLSVALMNPGPRHPAVRAVMEAGVSKTRSQNLLPIGLMVLSGADEAARVEECMRFLRVNKRKSPIDVAVDFVNQYQGPKNDLEIAPGFGPQFEQFEPLYTQLSLSTREKIGAEFCRYLDWSIEFGKAVNDCGCGIKAPALAGSVFLDVGIHPRFGPPLYQYMRAPGLIAHAVEMLPKPLSEMPFVGDSNYVREEVHDAG